MRDWRVWMGGAGVAVLVAWWFGNSATEKNDELEDMSFDESSYTFEQFEDKRGDRDRDALVANLSWSAATAFATVGLIMYVIRPSAKTRLVPSASTEGAGFVLTRRF
jgi:hypothetical protein